MSWLQWKESIPFNNMLHGKTTKYGIAVRTWAACVKEYAHDPGEYRRLLIQLKVELHRLEQVVTNVASITKELDNIELKYEEREKLGQFKKNIHNED